MSITNLDLKTMRQIAEMGNKNELILFCGKAAGRNSANTFFQTFTPTTIISLLKEIERLKAKLGERTCGACECRIDEDGCGCNPVGA
jgi:hypothetical protein